MYVAQVGRESLSCQSFYVNFVNFEGEGSGPRAYSWRYGRCACRCRYSETCERPRDTQEQELSAKGEDDQRFKASSSNYDIVTTFPIKGYAINFGPMLLFNLLEGGHRLLDRAI